MEGTANVAAVENGRTGQLNPTVRMKEEQDNQKQHGDKR